MRISSKKLSWLACASLLFACFMQTSYCRPLNFLHRREAQNYTNLQESSPRVRLYWKNSNHMVLDNGLVKVTLSTPLGDVTEIKYKGMEVLDSRRYKEHNRGYWDLMGSEPNQPNINGLIGLTGTKFDIITQNEDEVEVSFTRTWDLSQINSLEFPLNVDKRFIMRRGSSGIYTYSILDRPEGWPDVDIDHIRVVFKLNMDKFHYMAVSDDRQRVMPTDRDRKSSEPLAYKEAVLLTNPSNPAFKGEVDDKYQYAGENQNIKVHGWASTSNPTVGFWMIIPSDEFRGGGPTKQELTSHVGSTTLCVFSGTHYVGKVNTTQYRNGEPWRKVFGPVFVYLNSDSDNNNPRNLWEDAKRQMEAEVKSWPYNFVHSINYLTSDKRGTVSGQLQVVDRYLNEELQSGSGAYLGLAAPGNPGSWQTEYKGYQFWTRADNNGNFTIKNVRPGTYNLYGWVPGVAGDYKYEADIIVKSGSEINLGPVRYNPPRNGPTLWEIGIPDRTPLEFNVPVADPKLQNKVLSKNKTEWIRQYGIWDQYKTLYPDHDLVYTVGVSNYSNDWFYAHVQRTAMSDTPTTWQIKFDLKNVNRGSTYTLQMALASTASSGVQVRVNNPNNFALFRTGLRGRDNAIARHGLHGLYNLYTINVPGHLLMEGTNAIYLTVSRAPATFYGVMYDYLRLEGPPEI